MIHHMYCLVRVIHVASPIRHTGKCKIEPLVIINISSCINPQRVLSVCMRCCMWVLSHSWFQREKLSGNTRTFTSDPVVFHVHNQVYIRSLSNWALVTRKIISTPLCSDVVISVVSRILSLYCGVIQWVQISQLNVGWIQLSSNQLWTTALRNMKLLHL